jgi:ubiquitin C-terminal hydrolase
MECLKKYYEDAKTEGECNKCNRITKKTIHYCISKTARILTISLKRFDEI